MILLMTNGGLMAPGLDWCAPGGSRGYVTIRETRWEIGKRGSGWVLVIPAGKEFESSVPTLTWRLPWLQRWLSWFQPFHWWLSPDDPDFLWPANVHDALLEAGYRREFADSQWLEAAMSQGAPRGKSEIVRTLMRFRRFLQWIKARGNPELNQGGAA